MRKAKNKVNEKGFPEIRIDKKPFGRMDADSPAVDVKGVAYLKNLFSFDSYLEGVTGSKQYTTTKLPHLEDFDHITASQHDYTITKTKGKDFTSSLIGYYFVWPSQPYRRYEILNVLDVDRLLVSVKDDRAETERCFCQGSCGGFWFHKIIKKFILHIDERIFIADLGIPSWNEVYPVTYWKIDRNKSNLHIVDDDVVIQNASGIFKVNLTATKPYYYQVNTPPPSRLITDDEEDDQHTRGRKYLYTNLKMKGNDSWTYHKDRTDSDESDGATFIEHETGSTRQNADGKDWGEVFGEKDVGDGTETYGELTCGNGGIGINQNVIAWRGLNDAS